MSSANSSSPLPLENGSLNSATPSPSPAGSSSSPLNYLPHGLCQFDEDDRLVVSNSQFQRLYNLPDAAVVVGTHCDEMISRIPREDVRHLVASVAKEKEGFGASECTWRTVDGKTIAVSCEVIDGGGYAILHEDITRLQCERMRLSRLAREDSLTRLLNRSAFNHELNRQLHGVESGMEVALLCFDLDHFKPVNDTLGHPIGDKVLESVAQRVNLAIRSNDIVGRLGGDEFAILQVGGVQPSGSRALANRVIDTLSKPFVIDGHTVYIGVSIGVAIFPYDGEYADDLIKNADLALYRAKEDGRGVLRYFEPEMDAKMQARRLMEVELRQALINNEFEVNYQPVMDISSNRIVCFEALVRWNHPQRGRISPDAFVPIAEESGLISPLGEWVLRQSCLEASQWGDDIRVAVNLSSVQLRNRDLITVVASALKDSGLPARRLELEITETSLMSNTDLTIGLLHQIRSLGVRIAMDDFGTGYSSISYLRCFPFDKIKIDRSFISGVDPGGDTAALVRVIAALGTSLGVKTTAEGVETEAELESARAAGCTEIQGYLLSKPVPADVVRQLIERFRLP